MVKITFDVKEMMTKYNNLRGSVSVEVSPWKCLRGSVSVEVSLGGKMRGQKQRDAGSMEDRVSPETKQVETRARR